MTARTCLDCGIPQRHGERCVLCDRAYQYRRRRSPRLRGYDAAYRRERDRVIAAEPWCHTQPGCPYPDAGSRANPLTGGHTVPLSRNGYGSPLVPLCRSCNSAQGNRMPGEGGRSPIAKAGRGAPDPLTPASLDLRDDSRKLTPR